MASRLLVGCFSAIVLLVTFINRGLGFSSQFGTSGAHVSVQVSPIILAVWPIAIAALVISFSMINFGETNILAKWPRILFALFIDFALIFVAIVVPLCLAALFIEYIQVGVFSWQFSRTYTRSTDLITGILSIITFCILFVSFSIFLLNNRKTPGCLLTSMTLKLSEPIELWRCSVFGLFKYFSLALPILAINKKTLGGFELTAQLDTVQK